MFGLGHTAKVVDVRAFIPQSGPCKQAVEMGLMVRAENILTVFLNIFKAVNDEIEAVPGP